MLNIYIQTLSPFVLLPILFTIVIMMCVARKRKRGSRTSGDSSIEAPLGCDSSTNGRYRDMCLPCLYKVPDLPDSVTNYQENDFEYIVDKITVKKIPLSIAHTIEDINERRLNKVKTLCQEPSTSEPITPRTEISAYPVYTERNPRFAKGGHGMDVLDINMEVPRQHNTLQYVAIPTKAAIRRKDIMLTKREITNQYLNNFSSIFVHNLKEPVPKDPEQLPNIGSPYTNKIRFIDSLTTKFSSKGKRKPIKSKKKIVYNVEAQVENNPLHRMEEDMEDSIGDEPDEDIDKNKEIAAYRTARKQPPFSMLMHSHKLDLKPQEIKVEDIQKLDLGDYDPNMIGPVGVKPLKVITSSDQRPPGKQNKTRFKTESSLLTKGKLENQWNNIRFDESSTNLSVFTIKGEHDKFKHSLDPTVFQMPQKGVHKVLLRKENEALDEDFSFEGLKDEGSNFKSFVRQDTQALSDDTDTKAKGYQYQSARVKMKKKKQKSVEMPSDSASAWSVDSKRVSSEGSPSSSQIDDERPSSPMKWKIIIKHHKSHDDEHKQEDLKKDCHYKSSKPNYE